MNQRTFLGLTHNPFTPPKEGFFAGGDRKTHLEHLRHLSQWSRRILVVTGPFGIGKSSLFRELSGSLEPTTKAARLSGTVVSSEREALVGLMQGFGVAADLDAHADDLGEVIMRYVTEQEALGRVCMVMLDDAHLVEQQAIERLVAMVASSPLRLLLFAEADLITDLNRTAKKHELEWFEIRLTGFPKACVRDYLEWRFTQAHYRGRLPFTDEQLEKIVNRSSGNPSLVDSMANRLLADMESGEIRNAKAGFPATHAALAVVLVVLVGLVYLFVQNDPLSSLGLDSSGPVVVDAGTVVEEDVLESLGSDAAVTDSPFMGDEEGGDQSATKDLDSTALETNLVDTETAAVVVPADEQAEGTPQQDGPVGIAAQEVAEGVAQGTALGASEDPIAEAIEASPEQVIPPAVVEQPIEVEPELSAAELFKSAQWIMKQEGSRFTMQLLTLSSRSRAAAFINRQSNPEEFAVYRMQRDGKLLYVVIHGVFSGKAGAQAAVNGFSGEMASIKPWIRPLALVQDTIRNNPQ